MSERIRLLPRADLLSVEEHDRICVAFVSSGVRRLRFSRGEPLARQRLLDVMANVATADAFVALERAL